MTRTKYNVFVLDTALNPTGEGWHKVRTTSTWKKATEEIDRLRKRGVTEIRVTEVTTREVLNTEKRVK